MKKIFSILILIGIVAFQACEGPIGPEGPQGPQGEPGVVIVGTTYEVDLDFTAENDYYGLFDFPEDLVDSDAVLVYRLTAVDEGKDVWRQLPQTYFFNEGVLMYNFDYTVEDFSIFLDGAIDFSTLPDQWDRDQVFRVIVVPSDFPDSRIDYSNYEAVTKMLGIEEGDFQKIKAKNQE